MRRICVYAAIFSCVVSSPAITQERAESMSYSDAEIASAIDMGVRGKVKDLQHSCDAKIGGFFRKLGESVSSGDNNLRSFRITGQPPLARVAHAADAAKKQYRPVPTAADEEMRAIAQEDVFTVWVIPDAGGSMITASRLADIGVEHVVIRPRGDKEGRKTVQPLSIEFAGSDTAQNLFGGSVELDGFIATFASEDVRRIAKEADVETLVITTGGEFKCNLDDKRILRGYGQKK